MPRIPAVAQRELRKFDDFYRFVKMEFEF